VRPVVGESDRPKEQSSVELQETVETPAQQAPEHDSGRRDRAGSADAGQVGIEGQDQNAPNARDGLDPLRIGPSLRFQWLPTRWNAEVLGHMLCVVAMPEIPGVPHYTWHVQKMHQHLSGVHSWILDKPVIHRGDADKAEDARRDAVRWVERTFQRAFDALDALVDLPTLDSVTLPMPAEKPPEEEMVEIGSHSLLVPKSIPKSKAWPLLSRDQTIMPGDAFAFAGRGPFTAEIVPPEWAGRKIRDMPSDVSFYRRPAPALVVSGKKVDVGMVATRVQAWVTRLDSFELGKAGYRCESELVDIMLDMAEFVQSIVK
jgi:hypothetical protein